MTWKQWKEYLEAYKKKQAQKKRYREEYNAFLLEHNKTMAELKKRHCKEKEKLSDKQCKEVEAEQAYFDDMTGEMKRIHGIE